MKAVEYFEKYKERIADENSDISGVAAFDLLNDLLDELNQQMTKKNIETDHGLIGIVKEQNSKWNAMISMFEKEYGKPILARNGFNKYIVSIVPESKKFLIT